MPIFISQKKAIRFFTSNNMGVSKQTFLEVGGFNADLRIASEDRELCDRWLTARLPYDLRTGGKNCPMLTISHYALFGGSTSATGGAHFTSIGLGLKRTADALQS